ncbi:hypothetical protein VA596_25230 [Amycolatopsis sp., V23-08]|uniref:Uncharacterized protein n=1 Tax=Amycolatopsis heterodermiae TaxID=3110235 RepID=A0ABU5R9F4_9PSEU|nr:hypothetical protein [Amycolatopsis sp., V23-08]MEA5362862.1 hypothetical protein [Amycolatopsis sp., V23-08]
MAGSTAVIAPGSPLTGPVPVDGAEPSLAGGPALVFDSGPALAAPVSGAVELLTVAGPVFGCCGAGVATEAPLTLPATGAFVSGRVWFACPCGEKPGRPSVEVLPGRPSEGLIPEVLLVPLAGGFVLVALTLELPPAVGFVPVAFVPWPVLGVLAPELPAVVPLVPGFVLVPAPGPG